MLDIKFIREHPEVVKENIIKKNQHEKLDLVDSTLELDVKHRALIKDIQHLRKQRNELSLAIAQAKKKGEAVDDLHAQAAHIPGKIKALEEEQENIQSQIQHNCALMPNIMHQDVPYGKDDTQNKEIQRWGQTSHKDVLFHGEVLQENGWADFEASARVAGNGFYYLMGDVALLNQALIQYAIQFITKRGYTYVEPPLMINKATLQGVTSFAER
ncbi:MAG: serine--tRNA ligase, partial [Candidatus Woesearchaeota archaeon]